MSKFLCTVGTTPFNSLISYIISNFDCPNNDIFIQTAVDYQTSYIKSEKFIDNFQEIIDRYDLIITHAGAGSVYSLLERNKNIIVIPNLDRDDKHQKELARYVEENKYAQVCWNISDLNDMIINYKTFDRELYIRKSFFKKMEIIGIING